MQVQWWTNERRNRRDPCLDRHVPLFFVADVHKPASKIDNFRIMAGATKLLRLISADVLFTAMPAANVIFPLASLASFSCPKIFIAQHGQVYWYTKGINYLDGLVGAMRFVDGVICVSNTVRDSLEMKPKNYQRKVHVIHNALSPAIETLITQLRVMPNEHVANPYRIITFGRLHVDKNLSVVIRAMEQVNNAVLEIIGTGPDEAFLRKLVAECGVSERVRFTGLLSREDALARVARADIFVQPSRNTEGHSLALVEAAKLGVAMMVSAVPCQLEAITRNDGTKCGIAHDPDRPEAWAASLSALFSHPEKLKEYTELSRSLAEEIIFSNVVDQYENLIESE